MAGIASSPARGEVSQSDEGIPQVQQFCCRNRRNTMLAYLFIYSRKIVNLLIMSTTQTHKHSGASQKKTTTKSPASMKKAMPSKEEEGKLKEFFHDEIKDIYWAEKKLVQTLPKLAKAATSEELKNAFTEHLAQTKEHVARLEQVFELLGHKPQAKKC